MLSASLPEQMVRKALESDAWCIITILILILLYSKSKQKPQVSDACDEVCVCV